MAIRIYKQGTLSKKADSNLTFEQQLGTMTGARISDKLSILEPYCLGFELLKKDEDGTFGIGVMVYLMGDQVFYIPSFYNKGRLRTADMLMLASSQQFLPATEGVISYLKGKYEKEMGHSIPTNTEGVLQGVPTAVRTREDQDPLRKHASILEAAHDDKVVNILEEALHMGKQATMALTNAITSDTRVFNSFVDYYGLKALGHFKEASEKLCSKPVPEDTWVVNPFDKQASALSDAEEYMLNTFGFLVKTAKMNFSEVIKDSLLADEFITIRELGVYDVIDAGGKVHTAMAIPVEGAYKRCDWVGRMEGENFNSARKDLLHAVGARPSVVFIVDDLPDNTYTLQAGDVVGRRHDVSVRDVFNVLMEEGQPLESLDRLGIGDIVVTPDGSTFLVNDTMRKTSDGKTFISYAGDDIKTSVVRIDPVLKKSNQRGKVTAVPEGAIVLHNVSGECACDFGDNAPKDIRLATVHDYRDILDSAMHDKYRKVKIYSNGTSFTVTDGVKDIAPHPMSVKEASYHLVKHYGVDPIEAPNMILQTVPHDGVSNTTTRWYIQKQAADGDYTHGASRYDRANLGYVEKAYDGPEYDTVGTDGHIQTSNMSPERIREILGNAADSGIKEIFDVSVMKVLVNTSRPDVLIGDYYTTMLKMLDKLCRMMFLAHAKEDDFKATFGEDKYDELVETLKNCLDDLSELFVFINTRSIIDDTENLSGDDNLMDGML